MTASSLRQQAAGVAPGVGRLRHYERRSFGRDALAGVTVTAYLVPQVMGYATVAGLPVAAGLWSIVAALTVYALIGSSPQLSVGPEATTALMTATVIGPLAAGDPGRYAALAAVLALIVGAMCTIGRLARVGFLADLLSQPVLVGYMAGIAVLMVAGQLGRLTRVEVDGDTVVDQVRSFVEKAGDVHGPTMVLAGITLAVLLAGRAWQQRWPWALVGVLAATAVVATWSLDNHGIRLVGHIPASVPRPSFGDLTRSDLTSLLVPAIGVTIVAFSDNVLTARAFANRNGYDVSANQELLALGASNAASGLVGGFPVSSSASRTALADSMGSVSSMCSLVAVATTLGVMLVGRGVLGAFPSAALGAVVVFAAVKLVDLAGFRRLAHFRRSELLLALATTVAVLVADVLYGVLVAVGLSIVDLVRRMARPHDGVLGHVPGLAGMHDIDDYDTARQVPGLVVYRYDAPLCFVNAENFRHRAIAALDDGEVAAEWFLLNAEANIEIDSTGLDALVGLHDELQRRGVVLALARVKQELRDLLDHVGFTASVGADRIFPTLPTAVEGFEQWYRARHGSGPHDAGTS